MALLLTAACLLSLLPDRTAEPSWVARTSAFPTPLDPAPRPPRRIATVLGFWDHPDFSNAGAAAAMYGSAQSTHRFYEENSYGREKLVVDVLGPYQIAEPTTCDGIESAMWATMVAHGHSEDDYQQVMYHWTWSPLCTFDGSSSFGTPDLPTVASYYNGDFSCAVRAQELGHNYGMDHSRSYACVDAEGLTVPFSDDCEAFEYGDGYDPMGHGCGHINAAQKLHMGWIDGCNVVDAAENGAYNLLPLELPCAGTQALRIPTFDGRAYWLEYRAGLGFDQYQRGIMVRVAQPEIGGNFGTPNTYLLHFPTGDFLTAGDSYTDPEGSASFTIASVEPSHAVIEVQLPEGETGVAACRDGASPEVVEGRFGALTCADAPFPADLEPPTVAIVYPHDGEIFEPGASFTLQIEADDPRGVTDVDLYVDGAPVRRLLEPPWELDIDAIPEGEYELGAVARDGPNRTASAPVRITVGTPPSADTTGSETTAAETGESSGGGAGASSSAGESSETGASETHAGSDGCGCIASSSGTSAYSGLLLLAVARRRRQSSSIMVRLRA